MLDDIECGSNNISIIINNNIINDNCYDNEKTATTTTKLKPYKRQFVIGCSANSDDETTREAFAAGIDRFISKPFSLQCFLKVDVIEALLN